MAVSFGFAGLESVESCSAGSFESVPGFDIDSGSGIREAGVDAAIPDSGEGAAARRLIGGEGNSDLGAMPDRVGSVRSASSGFRDSGGLSFGVLGADPGDAEVPVLPSLAGCGVDFLADSLGDCLADRPISERAVSVGLWAVPSARPSVVARCGAARPSEICSGRTKDASGGVLIRASSRNVAAAATWSPMERASAGSHGSTEPHKGFAG